jgi:HTH-type transcriptional regulator / antitoxin MqsA
MCSICGGPAVLVEEPHTLKLGDRPVTFMDQFYRCGRCGEGFFHGEMMDASLRRATAVLRAQDGLLAPDEIVGLRKKYGLTQAELERLIGAGEKTVVRWERGTVAQNKTADTLLRVLLDHPEVVAALKRQNGLTKPARRRSSATAASKAKSAAAARP